MRLTTGFVWTVAAGAFLPSVVAAQGYTPWEPVLDLGGAELLNPQQLADRGRYPRHAVRNREQGQVVVAFDITAAGRARNCEIVRSSGHPRRDKVPGPLFEGWARFRPAHDAEGAPTATRALASAEFALAGG